MQNLNWERKNVQSNTTTTRKKDLTSSSELSEASPFSPGSHNLALDVGQVFLMGDLGTNYSDNIGFQFHYTYGVSDLFGLESSLGYSSHSEGRLQMTSWVAGLRTNLAWYDKVIPHLVFGLGFYRPSLLEGQERVSPVLFGIHLGPGVDLQVSKKMFFGVSLTFHDVFSSRENTSAGKALEIGGTYTTFLLHTGISL